MLLTLHEPIPSAVSSFFEALKTGGSTAVIGMVIVFAVLAIIFFAMVGLRKLLTQKKESPAETVAVIPEAPAPAEEAAPASDDSAIVAAIVAAISAHTGKAPTAFRVVSFKRRH